MVRFHWHVEHGGHAWVLPGDQYQEDEGLQLWTVGMQVEMPSQKDPLEALLTLPLRYLGENSVRHTGVLIAHGDNPNDYLGPLLQNMAAGLAAQAFGVARYVCVHKEGRRTRDLEKVLDAFATSPYAGNIRQWLLIGVGSGARVATTVSGRCRGVKAALVAISYPLLQPMPAPNRKQPMAETSEGPLHSIKWPMLFVRGAEDEDCPLDALGDVVNRLTGIDDVFMLEVPGVDAELHSPGQHKVDDHTITRIVDGVVAFAKAVDDSDLSDLSSHSLQRLKELPKDAATSEHPSLDQPPPPIAPAPPHPERTPAPPPRLTPDPAHPNHPSAAEADGQQVDSDATCSADGAAPERDLFNGVVERHSNEEINQGNTAVDLSERPDSMAAERPEQVASTAGTQSVPAQNCAGAISGAMQPDTRTDDVRGIERDDAVRSEAAGTDAVSGHTPCESGREVLHCSAEPAIQDIAVVGRRQGGPAFERLLDPGPTSAGAKSQVRSEALVSAQATAENKERETETNTKLIAAIQADGQDVRQKDRLDVMQSDRRASTHMDVLAVGQTDSLGAGKILGKPVVGQTRSRPHVPAHGPESEEHVLNDLGVVAKRQRIEKCSSGGQVCELNDTGTGEGHQLVDVLDFRNADTKAQTDVAGPSEQQEDRHIIAAQGATRRIETAAARPSKVVGRGFRDLSEQGPRDQGDRDPSHQWYRELPQQQAYRDLTVQGYRDLSVQGYRDLSGPVSAAAIEPVLQHGSAVSSPPEDGTAHLAAMSHRSHQQSLGKNEKPVVSAEDPISPVLLPERSPSMLTGSQKEFNTPSSGLAPLMSLQGRPLESDSGGAALDLLPGSLSAELAAARCTSSLLGSGGSSRGGAADGRLSALFDHS